MKETKSPNSLFGLSGLSTVHLAVHPMNDKGLFFIILSYCILLHQ